MNQDFFLALEDLEREKGISQAEFIAALENALVIAYKKSTGTSGGVEVRLNPEKKSIKIYSTKLVVEEVADPEKEISLEEAHEIKKSYKVGDVITTEIISKNFGRIAAQTAKQILMQKLREIERENSVNEFEDKEGELMACTVRRIEDGNVYVEIGGNQIEGVLMPRDQVPGEKYELNQKLNVYVKRVKSGGKMAQIVVSRTANGLVKRLFENEVPEIKQGIVQVKSVAREPGQRTKIAIFSEDPMVDAIGACVGNKGARVNAIVAELGGEKIDIITWSENPLEYISRALSPARVVKVIQTGDQSAMAIVPDDKLSLAIGRSGQNARLAVKLTGWKIDVKSESAAIGELGDQPIANEDGVEEDI
ncbi:MAG: transcription termination/antitermination protein NusA [Clostridiales bacterium]|nr:transcription termination/antitermination protein NusA [Clostridiales bacterium]MBQ3046549.1 transcription termination/antitermination protein NusA [Clostridia bacterium]